LLSCIQIDVATINFPGDAMTKKELKDYEEQLKALASRLSQQIWEMREEALRTTGNSDDAGLPAEQAECPSHETEEERTLNILESQQQVLREVEAAQSRLFDNTFGLCTECGSPITKTRLNAVPYASHCIGCADKLEHKLTLVS